MCEPNKKNVSSVVDEYLCLSCGACSVACKHNAITYRETVGGFLFPEIDSKSCVNCGLCYEVCPGVNFNRSLISQMPKDPFVGNILSCRVGKATNKKIYDNSQGGGIATALIAHLLEKKQISGAIVATMEGSPPRGKAILVTSLDELISAQKSKYIPIPMLSVLNSLNKIEGPVAFIGLPCQIHGLNNLIDLFPNLESKIFIKIGLICDRIQTSAVIDYFGHKATKQSITNFTFRDKTQPSYPGNPVVTNKSGDEIVLDSSLRIAVKDFFTPPRCRLCFDKLNVYADVVAGDPHGIKGVDRTGGETLVFTRTDRGEEAITCAINDDWIKTRFIDAQSAVNGQKISRRQLMWSNYIQCWDKLGRKIPDYPKSILIFAENCKCGNKKYMDDLLTGLKLDSYSSRLAIMGATDRWLLKRRIFGKVKWPFTTLKIVINKIVKRGRE